MGLRRVPSFSSRPGFPSGLRVLMVESDGFARESVEALLKECSYAVTACPSLADAVSRIETNSSYDVLLAEARTLGNKAADSTAFMKLVQTAPLIVMSENPTHEDVLLSIKLGAVDFIEKPLSLQKVKTIWQHTVRQMLRGFSIKDSCPVQAASPGSSHSSQEMMSATIDDVTLIKKRRSLDSDVVRRTTDVNGGLSGSDTRASAGMAAETRARSLPPMPTNVLPLLSQHSAVVGAEAACPAISDNNSGVAQPWGRVEGLALPSASLQRGHSDVVVSMAGNHVEEGGRKRKSCEFPAPARLAVPPVSAPAPTPSPSAQARHFPPVPRMAVPSAGPCASTGLMPGMAWGVPMNPFNRAPGITPPVFPPPATLPPPGLAPAFPWMPNMCGPMVPPNQMPLFPGVPSLPGMPPFASMLSMPMQPMVPPPTMAPHLLPQAPAVVPMNPGMGLPVPVAAVPAAPVQAPSPPCFPNSIPPQVTPGMVELPMQARHSPPPQVPLQTASDMPNQLQGMAQGLPVEAEEVKVQMPSTEWNFKLEDGDDDQAFDFDFDLDGDGDLDLGLGLDVTDPLGREECSLPPSSPPYLASLGDCGDDDFSMLTATFGECASYAPLGLFLKKSDSLADLVNAALLCQPIGVSA